MSPIRPNELNLMMFFSYETTTSIISFDVSISLIASFRPSLFFFWFVCQNYIKSHIDFYNKFKLDTFIIILFSTLSLSNSKFTSESVSIVLTLHSVIIPLSSRLKILILKNERFFGCKHFVC